MVNLYPKAFIQLFKRTMSVIHIYIHDYMYDDEHKLCHPTDYFKAS